MGQNEGLVDQQYGGSYFQIYLQIYLDPICIWLPTDLGDKLGHTLH